jgi:hypothetical protein
LPLSEKARIEVYIPDSPSKKYRDLLEILDRDFTRGFEGCSIIRGLDGSFLNQKGIAIKDRVNLIYSDAPFRFEKNWEALDRYADHLRQLAFAALDEEAVLVVIQQVFHSVP